MDKTTRFKKTVLSFSPLFARLKSMNLEFFDGSSVESNENLNKGEYLFFMNSTDPLPFFRCSTDSVEEAYIELEEKTGLKRWEVTSTFIKGTDQKPESYV